MIQISKKRIVIVLLSLCIGYGAGWMAYRLVTVALPAGYLAAYGFNRQRIENLFALQKDANRKIEESDREATLMSIAALDLLSEGWMDEAKRLLANKVVEFYARFPSAINPEGNEISQEQRDFLQNVEEVSEISPALKQAIEEATAK